MIASSMDCLCIFGNAELAIKAWAAQCAVGLNLHQMYLSFALAGSMPTKLVHLLLLCTKDDTARCSTGQGFRTRQLIPICLPGVALWGMWHCLPPGPEFLVTFICLDVRGWEPGARLHGLPKGAGFSAPLSCPCGIWTSVSFHALMQWRALG